MISMIGAVVVAGMAPALDRLDRRALFVEDLTRTVSIRREPWFLVGRLDARGEFTETERVPIDAFPSGGVKRSARLNWSFPPGTSVYEFRSGVLIPGTFDDNGYFGPDVKGKLLKFADYEFSADAPKIWNLPGLFLTLTEAKKYKAAIAPQPGYQFKTSDKR